MFGLGDWINRKRHNRGFGIQSPSAFFFITQVLREKLPYYAYSELETAAGEQETTSAGKAKELFRIANYLQPSSCIVIGTAVAACAIAAARPNAGKLFLTEEQELPDKAKKMLKTHGCSIRSGNTQQLLHEAVKENSPLGLLYLGNCNGRAEILEAALQHTNSSTVIIVDDIRSSKETAQWWKGVIENPATIVTYDMHSYGILFFDKERYKQNYTLKR